MLEKQKRPALKYYGGGWRRGAWTVSHFPPHESYLEPCFGSGAVYLQKERCKIETVNDIDSRVVNFFRVLRDDSNRLMRSLYLSPWAEDEFVESTHVSDNSLEDARRFFISCWQSVQGGPSTRPGDFRWNKKVTRRSPATQDVSLLAHLQTAAAHLRHVQILNRDALRVISDHKGTGCLIYFDPPYLNTVRGGSGYSYRTSEEWHTLAGHLLSDHDGPIVVSGYASELYYDLYGHAGFTSHAREFSTNSGGREQEIIWTRT